MRRAMMGAALVLGAVTLGSTAAAQTPTGNPTNTREAIQNVLNLPKRTDESRKAGTPDREIQSVLDIFREKKVPPAEQEEILIAQKEATEKHGPVDNFGAFVQTQLDQGKRGKELAAAIHAEHEKRGKGHGQGHDKAKQDEKVKGKDDAAIDDRMRAERGKSEKAAEKGKPEEPKAMKESAKPEDAATKGQGKRPEKPGGKVKN